MPAFGEPPGRSGLSPSPSGVLAIDKPAGWTSHDVVAVLRGLLGTRRVGHGGTLDPLATGVLAILVGAATKEAGRLHLATKAYAALVRFGVETATDDAEGAPTRSAPAPDLDAGGLAELLAPYRGATSQVPPAYAAVKVRGRPAYARARAGEVLDLAPRAVTIARLDVASWRTPDLRLLVVCSGGTYVRALARDLGRAAGSVAHLATLRRLAVGGLTLEGAPELAVLRAGGQEAALSRLHPLTDTDLALPARFHQQDAELILGGWQEDPR